VLLVFFLSCGTCKCFSLRLKRISVVSLVSLGFGVCISDVIRVIYHACSAKVGVLFCMSSRLNIVN
jgi:hypothetical protein